MKDPAVGWTILSPFGNKDACVSGNVGARDYPGSDGVDRTREFNAQRTRPGLQCTNPISYYKMCPLFVPSRVVSGILTSNFIILPLMEVSVTSGEGQCPSSRFRPANKHTPSPSELRQVHTKE